MKNVAVKNIERTDLAIADGLLDYGVATVHEAQGKTGLLDPSIRPIYPGARIAGNAVTVLMHPGDNWMLHVAMELCQPGDVLVASCLEPCSDGFFGDLLATSAKAHGVRGLIIEGGVRDVADLRAMQFPVWSTAIHAQGTVKETLGSANIPITCGGQKITPGDLIVADDDGVCIVKRQAAGDTLVRAQERKALEQEKRARLAAGVLGLDIYDMRPELERKGLQYLDTLEEYESVKRD